MAVARKAKGFSKKRLAKALGVDPSTVGRWEASKTVPAVEVRPRLRHILGRGASRIPGRKTATSRASSRTRRSRRTSKTTRHVSCATPLPPTRWVRTPTSASSYSYRC
ncbi:MAG: multiprotein-bridging factor 1 family protein [Candidatus Binatia bacterium]